MSTMSDCMSLVVVYVHAVCLLYTVSAIELTWMFWYRTGTADKLLYNQLVLLHGIGQRTRLPAYIVFNTL